MKLVDAFFWLSKFVAINVGHMNMGGSGFIGLRIMVKKQAVVIDRLFVIAKIKNVDSPESFENHQLLRIFVLFEA